MYGQSLYQCLAYVPVSHVGYGWVGTCVNILENFPGNILAPTIVLPRAFRAVAPTVCVKQASPPLLPYRVVSRFAQFSVERQFQRAMSLADPKRTIIYFWPAPPISLVQRARALGFLTVREMINTCAVTSTGIMAEAYYRLGLQAEGQPSDEAIADEIRELVMHDYIIAPSPRVEDSLVHIGIDRSKILRSSYGWNPSRFAGSISNGKRTSFTALFIGADSIRKGLPQLLAAWERSAVNGELLINTSRTDAINHVLARYPNNTRVRFIDPTNDVGGQYRSADVLVFPSLEEGDPLVTYEAAGCGLPVITTPMGSANIIRHGVNGLIVAPHDIEGLAKAISCLAGSAELRTQFGLQAAHDAEDFTYDKVGKRRAVMLSRLLADRR